MGGAKLKTILRAGSDQSGICAARALRAIVYTEIATDRQASSNQTNTQRVGLDVAAASAAAPSAVAPITIVPQPDTAVNVAAASIVSRMNRRLSIARACISGGSGGRSGSTRVMEGEWRIQP